MDGLSLLAVLLTLAAPPDSGAHAHSPSKHLVPGLALSGEACHSDARLSDVCFVDRQRGWAVGDCGTIWQTDDGGRRWSLQHSGVTCPLHCVFFLDEKTGWAVGGWTHPYAHTSSGVVLTTRDGGRHWHFNAKLLLPMLRRVRFFDERNGWALGCPSAMFPAGVFVTSDGGQSFNPLGTGSREHWLAADFLTLRLGAVAGRDGLAAVVQNGQFAPVGTPACRLRNLRQLKLLGPRYGWLVGDGGLVWLSGDLGATWESPSTPLPENVAGQFDFAALAVRGPKLWIAGSPGTLVFHSADAGRSWASYATGGNLPIYGLCFVDDRQGWAVGALGIILATDDGGRTWRRQRSGGTRAAVLGLFSQAEDVPLELFARLSGSDGYLGVVEVLALKYPEVPVSPRDEVPEEDRLREALVAAGGSDGRLAWQFPVRAPGLQLGAEKIAETWDRLHPAGGLDALEAHVIKQIRLWRPDVIVTDDAGPRGDDPLRHLINQVVLRAVPRAADPSSFPEQRSHAGLEPWQVKKVYAALPPPERGSLDLTTAQFAPRLGRSLAEVTAAPRGLLSERFSLVPPTLGFRLLASQLPQEQAQRDFFAGIVLRPGSEARRELSDPPSEQFDSLQRIAERRRNMQAILERFDRDGRGGSQWLGQAEELTRGLDYPSAGQILFQLADRYYRTGRWDLAAETFGMLTERYGEHPLSRPALVWLVQYYASGEAAWRFEAARPHAVRQASTFPAESARADSGPERAAALGRQIERSRPDLFALPAVRFPLAAATRRQGGPRQAERFSLPQLHATARDPWWACAQGEAWLAERRGKEPKPVLRCVTAESKPRLDGKLDDALWQQAKPAYLQSPLGEDADWPAVVLLAHDAEFLYLAVRCRMAPGAKYQATAGPRPRDADLSRHDRLSLLIDLDRDFATYYHLAVDHRGWTAEDCWGDSTWNPTWFVAADSDGNAWTVEAAIPLDQLTGRQPKPGDAWAIGLQRIVPGVGFQSWNTPAAVAIIPEGFGYLVFE